MEPFRPSLAICGICRRTMPDQKVAVITGSSSGIGLLTAIEFAQHGYTVVATLRDLGRAMGLEEAAQRAGVPNKLDIRRLDVTEFDSISGVIDGIARDHGRIDVLVNNAGFSMSGFAEDMSLDELRRQFDTNFFGVVALSKAVIPVMRRQKTGCIIQVASIAGRVGNPLLSAYCSSKFAVEGWSESVRMELRTLGIRVVVVEPGSFDTDIWTRNVTIAKGALDPNSPNRERARRFSEFVKGRSKKYPDARVVAQLILRIANNPNPRLRYMIGRDAKLHLLAQRLLPWRTYERMITKAVKID
jgi:NAD(P)-dependent dehydrogenase (short-subunit alcohol dehydrogenase family)